MRINRDFFISMERSTKTIRTNLIGRKTADYAVGNPNYYNLLKILQVCRKRSYTTDVKNRIMSKWLKMAWPAFTDEDINNRLFSTDPEVATSGTNNCKSTSACSKLATLIASNIIKFFSEFSFTPSFRFINTLALAKDKTEYVVNYFNLQNHSFTKEITEKVKSGEFRSIIAQLNELKANTDINAINSRFDLYFGEPGTGKTTVATEQGTACIVCSSDMLPTDLMQNFAFSDGKAEFQKSDLWKAMEEGYTIVLDELNMLPFESLRFLQGILDNKNAIDFKGFHINIHKDFKVIGTMNLNVNGQCIPLPAPLVDRCSSITEYKMNASILSKALVS